MKEVFISYSSVDLVSAETVRNVLEKNGLSCWMAPRDIPGGSNYTKEIPGAIRNCKAFVLILSENAQSSHWVLKELDSAVNCGKVILPFMVEDCTLNDEFNFLLTGAQRYAAYQKKAEALEILIGRIRNILDTSGNDPAEEQSEQPSSTSEPKRPEKKEPPAPWLSNCVVFDLSLTALTGGTRYRGDFEEKVNNLLAECRKHPNIILFIDEIHQMNKLGDGVEGGATMGQVLKPALARAEIRVIGATTTEESRFLKADKALARRFTEVELQPLRDEAATMTAKGIMETYLKLHGVSAPNVSSAFLLDKINAFLPNTVFPDNFINVVDETLASAVFDGLTEVEDSHFNATLSRLAGVVIV